MSNETYNSYLDAEGLALVLSGIRDKINAAAEGITNTKGKANGIASLDAGGNVPLSQLGNLDTTFFEVVTELPTDIRNIKKHIYILKGNKDGDNNKYVEYIYTGDLTDAGVVDATKWEKLGDFVPTFDLQEYVKKKRAVAKLKFYDPVLNDAWNDDDDQPYETAIRIEFADGSHQYLVVPKASAPTNTSRSNSELSDSEKSKPFISPGSAGFMSPSDKGKLDKIDLNALTASINAANTAATNTNKAIQAAETATTGAEKVNANLTDDNIVEITNRNGTTKSVSLDEAVKVGSDVNRIKQTLGAYSDREDVVLTPKEKNKAISSDGVKVTKQGWAIAEFTAEKGNEYLFKPNVIDGSVCVFAEYITSIETRGIDYTYTYNEDGTIATATATYLGKTHVYTYEWTVEAGVNTPTIKEGDTIVSNLPMTYETKVGTYSPLVKLNEDAELPIDGYCRYMSHFKGNSSIKIVVSYKVGTADLTMKVLRDGVLASISTQLGNLSQKEDETRKKVEEYHGSYMELLCKTDTIVIVDGKEVTIPARKRTKVYPKVSYKPKILAMEAGKETMPTILLADVSHLDTSNFTSMDSMFRNCYLLTELDVSHFDTSKVTNMSAMFKGCSSLTSLNVSGFDTSKVTNMSAMFIECSAKDIDLRAWNVENVTEMNNMFESATTEVINLTDWNAVKCTNMVNMFNYCTHIKTIYGLSTLVKAACQRGPSFVRFPAIDLDLSGWDTSGLKWLDLSFYMSSIGTVDCSGDGWNNVNVSNWYRFLEGAKRFKLGKNFFNIPLIDSITITSYVAKEYLVEGSYDRKSNGLVDLTLNLNRQIKNELTESDIATMTAKGYVIA
nr:BspA family leucine-rich repeat surface protein [uncultured Prevotella sp.]